MPRDEDLSTGSGEAMTKSKKKNLEPLPFEAPERLVSIYNSYPGAGAGRGTKESTRSAESWARQTGGSSTSTWPGLLAS